MWIIESIGIPVEGIGIPIEGIEIPVEGIEKLVLKFPGNLTKVLVYVAVSSGSSLFCWV